MSRPRHVVVAAVLIVTGLGALTPGAGAAPGPARGGTVRVAYSAALNTLDPAQAYTDDWWLINGTVFNGLYLFDRNDKPQLNLVAALPVISAGRTVWTFTIRKDARFSNGMPVTAEDLRYSITRSLDPHLKPGASWGQSQDLVFAGAAEFVAGKAKSVSGIQVVNRSTIRFVLAQPFANLPSLLAETFNMAMPAAAAAKQSADDVTHHPIGAGPFMLQSWQRGSQAVLVRNPYYFRNDRPYLDKIIAYENVTPSLIALKIQKGEVDGFGNDQEVAAPDLHQMSADPKYAGYVVTAASAAAVWLDLNTHVAPLNNLKVRQAIAMAISRRRLVQLLGGNGLPATQMYIPLDAQHDPTMDSQAVYPYDLAKAAALVKASGVGATPITVLYSTDQSYYAAMAPGIQQQLQQIGLNVTLKGVSESTRIALTQPLTGHQVSFDLWSMDYPDGADIYSGAMSCGANAAGGLIGAHYCDAAADVLVTRAQGLPLGAVRDALLRRAQRQILGAAAQIPLVFIKSVELVSPRVGGFYYQPAFGWQFENYRLTR